MDFTWRSFLIISLLLDLCRIDSERNENNSQKKTDNGSHKSRSREYYQNTYTLDASSTCIKKYIYRIITILKSNWEEVKKPCVYTFRMTSNDHVMYKWHEPRGLPFLSLSFSFVCVCIDRISIFITKGSDSIPRALSSRAQSQAAWWLPPAGNGRKEEEKKTNERKDVHEKGFLLLQTNLMPEMVFPIRDVLLLKGDSTWIH